MSIIRMARQGGMTEERKIELYGAVVGTYESSSSPGKYYEVRRKDANTYSCNCRGWANYRRCKHCEAARAGNFGLKGRGGSPAPAKSSKSSAPAKKGKDKNFDLDDVLKNL